MMPSVPDIKSISLVVFVLGLNACSLEPKYTTPEMTIPAHYKETGRWIKLDNKPKLMKRAWWQAFHDTKLDLLEEQLTVANQDLRIAYANYQQAAALAKVARAALFPNIQGLFNANRIQTSLTIANPSTVSLYDSAVLGATLNYEVDAWGQIRSAVLYSQKLADASAYDIATIQLSIHAELAYDYLSLRAADESIRILERTVRAYEKALYLTKKRYSGGVAPIADVYQAKTQLENAKTLTTDTRLKRSQLEHAIAVLVGEIPSNFCLQPGVLPRRVVKVSTNLPSTLLIQRPDIIAAELRVQAANANIGVARAAFLPIINLTGLIAYNSQTFSNLLTKPSLVWALGPITALTITQPIAQTTLFDGGKLLAQLKKAKSDYYETVARYRKTVLSAFQDVEDSLSAIHRLDQELQTQRAATNAAKNALYQAQKRYMGGIATFLDVVVTENTALQAELALVNIKMRRQMASVQLIKALGGPWPAQHPISALKAP